MAPISQCASIVFSCTENSVGFAANYRKKAGAQIFENIFGKCLYNI